MSKGRVAARGPEQHVPVAAVERDRRQAPPGAGVGDVAYRQPPGLPVRGTEANTPPGALGSARSASPCSRAARGRRSDEMGGQHGRDRHAAAPPAGHGGGPGWPCPARASSGRCRGNLDQSSVRGRGGRLLVTGITEHLLLPGRAMPAGIGIRQASAGAELGQRADGLAAQVLAEQRSSNPHLGMGHLLPVAEHDDSALASRQPGERHHQRGPLVVPAAGSATVEIREIARLARLLADRPLRTALARVDQGFRRT